MAHGRYEANLLDDIFCDDRGALLCYGALCLLVLYVILILLLYVLVSVIPLLQPIASWRLLIFANWIIDDYLSRYQHLLLLLCYAVLALLTLASAIHITRKAVKQFRSAQVTREQAIAGARSNQEVVTFLTTNKDISRMVVSKLSVRDMIRFSIVETSWRAILQERAREPEESKVKDWYFPLWFQDLHPDRAIDSEPSPNLTFPLLPTRRYTNLRWHGLHHDNTSHIDDHSLPFLDFLWDVSGEPPLGFIFAATSGGLLLFYKFIYLPKGSTSRLVSGHDRVGIFTLLTVCNPLTKQSRDLPFPFRDHYHNLDDFCEFFGDDMHLVVDDSTSNAYRVLMVTVEFVKEWSSVSNEWATSSFHIYGFVEYSSLYYQGCLYVLMKLGSVLAVTLLKRNEWGTWEVDDDVNKHFATVYEGGEMTREYFGGSRIDMFSNLRLLGCNGLLYAVMMTEEDSDTKDTSLVRTFEFHVFELPEGCRSFVKVARIPFSNFTKKSSEYKYDRHDIQWYQGLWQDKYCCTVKCKEIWIACQGYLFCYDVVTGGWRKDERQHTNNFENSISAMPYEPSITAKP